MKLKEMLALLAAAAATVWVAGCNSQAAAPMPPPAAPAVTVATAESSPLVEWNEFTGRTEPVEFVEIRPRVSGHIQEVRFQSGQLVKKGDVLVVIDPRWHQAELDRREAELAQARVRLENAEREAARTTQLLASKAISQEEGDARQARFHEAKAALQAAQAGRDSARLDLDYTAVRAPIDGRVSRQFVTAGNYVSGQAGAATLLTTIVSVDPVYVYADMDEQSLLRFNALLREGNLKRDDAGGIPVELQLADETGFPHRGRVESLDNRLDASMGSIVLRALFPNPDGRIVPGLFARIRVPASAPHDAVLVSESAIGTDQSQKFVFTLSSSNTVAYRRVTLGPSVNDKRVIREGLSPGEQVVVNGLQRVRPGMPVTPEPESGPANAATGFSTAKH